MSPRLFESLGRFRADPVQADANIVAVSAGGRIGGLEVDRFGDRMDVMLKPMESPLHGMPGVSGASLLGEGNVLIVLDLKDLLQ